MPGWRAACFKPQRKHGDSYGHNRGTEELSLAVNRLGFNNETKKATSIVELRKEGSTLGLIISGGIDKGCKPQISNLRPGSIAHRSDALAVGDCILSINGIRTDYLKHEEIINLLKNAEERVILEVEYEIPASLIDSSLCVCPKVIQIKLEKENGSFGFTVRGGACSDRLKSRPLTITHVRVGGPADRDGTIKAGDKLLAVDSINITSATLQEALAILKQVAGEALLTIEYDVSILDAVCNASGPLLVEIDQTPGRSLGITLTRLPRAENAIVIESIKQASIAERCGALHVGDHILAVDGTSVDHMTPAEVMQLLKVNVNDVIKLEILPVRQIGLHQVPDTNVHRGMVVPLLSLPYSVSGFNTLSSLGRQSVSSYVQYQPFHSSAKWIRNIDQMQSPLPLTSSSSNASLVPSGVTGQVCHVETMQVSITADYYGFGFSLQGPVFATELLTSPPVICSIDAGGAAEKTGLLQVGDRILAVNNKPVKGITVEEVTRTIQQSHPRVTLDIEFDVAESVVPSSGTFTIKLAKKGSGLGITIASPKNRNNGSTLIIADIRKGSVAHRTGTLQPGDKLLAIDSIRMDNCTIEDAAQILQDCDQIVKLRIQKDEAFSEDVSVTGSVVYTVELTRNGGPLGITISGSEEPFEPILISGLTEDGLAERTGALHVGDRLLAINGQSLRGKPLSEAIIMLQNSGDSVTLKISKKSTSPNPANKSKDPQCIVNINDGDTTKYITPLPSIDSAIESWDSCGLDLSVNGAQSHSKSDNEFCDSAQASSSLNNNQSANIDKDRLQVVAAQTPKTADIAEENWELKTTSSHSYLSSNSAASEEDKADWTKVLEDLETCGQSQLLRQIERTIMGSTPSVLSNCCAETTTDHSNYDFPLESSALPENMPDVNRTEKWQSGVISNNRTQCCKEDGESSNCQDRPSVPIPIEVRKVTLFKDRFYEDFGFSVSDGLYERGVYINRIRTGGPADLSGILRPLDRILQVNETKTHNYDCCLTVPLIASAGERIELLVSRPAYTTMQQPSNVITGHHNHPWVDDEDTEIYSCIELANGSQTLTKTL